MRWASTSLGFAGVSPLNATVPTAVLAAERARSRAEEARAEHAEAALEAAQAAADENDGGADAPPTIPGAHDDSW